MIVVLAEKPAVGREIAKILGANRKGEGYLEGSGYIVTWAYGHLVELPEPQEYDPALKQWSLGRLPIIPDPFELKVSGAKGVKTQFNVIKKLFKSADSIICATDAGREGELIFRYILKLTGCEKKCIKRLWISSLTDSAIQEGFKNLKPLSDFDRLAQAAQCRSEADWLVGMNATRGYTVKFSNGNGVLSVGRVQTPVLALIVKRELEIRNFKPEDYWELWTSYREVKFKHKTDRYKEKKDAELMLAKVAGQLLKIVKVDQKKVLQPFPQLFDLTELQKTMNRLHGLTAAQTLEICQNLYEKKYISYPRTDSRYLSEDLFPGCKNLLQKLSNAYSSEIAPINKEKLSKSKRTFNNAKVTDHHAIIPTGQLSGRLDGSDALVFQAICIRFIAQFYPDCEKMLTTVRATAAEEEFIAKGSRITSPGWFALYKSEPKENKEEEPELPLFEVGEQGPHIPEIKTCKTKAPPHYTEATLLGAMETAGKTVEEEELKEALKEKGLGTPATRASVIETLLKREYIKKEKKLLVSTPKGDNLINLLQKEATLTSAEMTAEWEFGLKQIEKGLLSRENFMDNIRKWTQNLVTELQTVTPPNESDLGPCPLCQNPVIKGNTGYGCSQWKTGCAFRFTREQFGTILEPKDVVILLNKKRLTHPRKLLLPDNTPSRGYITIESDGKIGIVTKEEKELEGSIGSCPVCAGAVTEKYKAFSCLECKFVIWKKIAGRDISTALAAVLLSIGKTKKIAGFKSKAGKPFGAALKIEAGKVIFDFNEE